MANKRVLIFSAGAHIHNTYSVTAEDFKPTHVYVMVEESVYNIAESKPEDEAGHRRKEEMQQIVDSINKLKEHVTVAEEGRERKFEVIQFPQLTQDQIQEKVLSIRDQYPDAEYLFNVTAGTALFSTTLFLMAIWMGAEVCITRNGKDAPIYLNKPEITLDELQNKPELKKIIKELGKSYPKSMSNKELMKNLGYEYVEYVGTKYEKRTRSSIHSKRMDQLIKKYKLVTETQGNDKREKSYCLTSNGRFAYNFIRKDLE